MSYQLCPGVVLATVCGEHMLIATRAARETVPSIRMLNDSAAYFWKLLQEQTPVEEIPARTAQDYDITAEQAQLFLQQFMDAMAEQGYLTLCGDKA